MPQRRRPHRRCLTAAAAAGLLACRRGAFAARWNTFWNLGAPPRGEGGEKDEEEQEEEEGRREDGATKAQRLRLPKCDWGPLLNFAGAYRGDKCLVSDWLVEGLERGAPADLHAAQVAERAARQAAAAAAPAPG